MNMCNKVVRYVKKDPSIGLTFLSGVLDWDGEMCIGSVTDASHADEMDELSGEGYRSQGGRITMLASMGLLRGESCYWHPIGFASNSVRRVCRATIQAESYKIQEGSEQAD
eukprot:11146554-Lingulodinium_polyedra.AAC.1